MKVNVYTDTKKEELLYRGELLTWGIDHDFLQGGTFSIAIVKKPDGSIEMVYPERIKVRI